MTLVLHDELFDAQLVRALAYTAQGGAEIGECLETARRITRTDGNQWYDEWSATAARVEKAAEESDIAGHRVSARGAWLRASNYYRTAGLFLMGAPVDDRFRESSRRQTETFRKGAALLDLPPDLLEIPFEDGTLPGYFFRAADDGRPRPTVLLVDGYDGTAEELYFANAVAALDRGYDVLAFDGPGQGSVILDQGVPFRPDWETVVRAVVDHALTLAEVDPQRIVVHGWSFGGYLAPRAASGEHRLAACIADSGPYDLFDTVTAKFPSLLAGHLDDDRGAALRVVETTLHQLLKKPSAGWALRRNLWVHGVRDPLDFIRLSHDYTLRGREHLIRCPVLVCRTVCDDLSASARTLAENLTCPTEYVELGPEDGVTGHCEMTGRAVFHRRVYDWLDETLEYDGAPA
ncbi:MAG: alpha/beta hydrolase [Oerskovia sp.]|jgi:pimeloyl-ACP methyl ester carboxylesterase|nr:alpha/beta hydrolase [Oerskovia sp.]